MSGSEFPAITTDAPASVNPSGSCVAGALPFERFSPNSEMIDPGASGVLPAKLAPLTAAASVGAGAKSPSPPVTSRAPARFRAGSFAEMVSVTGPLLWPESHVLFHMPFTDD